MSWSFLFCFSEFLTGYYCTNAILPDGGMMFLEFISKANEANKLLPSSIPQFIPFFSTPLAYLGV